MFFFLVVSALAFSARGHGFDPRGRRGKFRYPNILCVVSFAGMTLNKCALILDRDVNWRPLVQGESPPVQVKEPYTVVDMITDMKTGMYNVHLLISLESGCSSMYRKTKKDTSSQKN